LLDQPPFRETGHASTFNANVCGTWFVRQDRGFACGSKIEPKYDDIAAMLHPWLKD